MKLNVDTALGCLGTYPERYVPGGYHDELAVECQLEIMSKINGLTGLSVCFPPDSLPNDTEAIVRMLSDHGLRVSYIEVVSWDDRRWKHGASSTNQKDIRRQTIQLYKEAIDFAKELNAESVLLWPAHDGFDFPFQVGYLDGWRYMVDTIKEIGEYERSVRIALEYKSKDPRQKQYVSNVGKTLVLLNDIGLQNIGSALDVGHALMAQESLAESLVLLDSHRKLFQVHLNENYRDSDPDLIFGTINFWEILEFFYYLNKTDFEGWCSIDIISAREDRSKSLELAVQMTWKMKELADRLTEHSKDIENNLNSYSFADNMNLITGLLF
jgi:xylose isomerase